MSADQVSRHQRGRVIGAMVESVARQGYEKATVGEVVALAGVSKTAFYRNFASKQECFSASFEEIAAGGTEQIRAAYGSRQGVAERLRAAFERLAELIEERPAEARLVIVDLLSLGAASAEPRAQAVRIFESFGPRELGGAGWALSTKSYGAGDSRRSPQHRLSLHCVTGTPSDWAVLP